MQRKYFEFAQSKEKELLWVDKTLIEKEKLFEHMTESSIMMENNLVKEMKKSYHNKIIKLEKELKDI